MRQSVVQRLRDQDFEDSYAVPFSRSWEVRCSCCEALVINGVPTHETGCPNARRDDDGEE